MNRRALILVAVGLAVALGLWWRFDGGGGRATVEVKMPTLSAVAKEGQALFSANCAACHGTKGGGTDSGPPLVHIIYEPSHHGDESFQRAVAQGVRAHHWNFGDMQSVAGVNRSEVAKIVSFVREIQRTNGIN